MTPSSTGTEAFFLVATPSRTILAAVQSSSNDPSAPASHSFRLHASLPSDQGSAASTSAQWVSKHALAKTFEDGHVGLISFDSPKGKARSLVETGVKGGPVMVCDGKGGVIIASSRSLSVIDADGMQRDQAIKGHISAPNLVSQANDGSMVAVHSPQPSTLTLVLPSTSTSHALSYRPARPLTSLLFSPTRRTLLAAGTSKGSVHVWDTTKPTSPRHSFADLHDGPVTALAFAPQPKAQLMLTAGADGNIKVVDLEKLEVKTTLRFGVPITTLAWSSNMTTVLIGTATGKVIHQDLRMAASRKPLALEISREAIHSLAFALPGGDIALLDIPSSGASSGAAITDAKGRAPLGVISINAPGSGADQDQSVKRRALVAASRPSIAPSATSTTSSRKRAEPDFTRRPSPVQEKAPLAVSNASVMGGLAVGKSAGSAPLARRVAPAAAGSATSKAQGQRIVSAPVVTSEGLHGRGSADEVGKLAKGRGANMVADASLLASEGDGSVLGAASHSGEAEDVAFGSHGAGAPCPHCGGSPSSASSRLDAASQHALATKDDLAELGSTIEGRLKELAMENLRSQRRARRELEAMLRRLLLGSTLGEEVGEEGEVDFGASVGMGLDLGGSLRGNGALGASTTRGGVADELKRLREENEALRAQLGANRAWRGY